MKNIENNYLLCGSYAYDTILIHQDEFHKKILPESIKKLNISFGMKDVQEEFGGTAGNIAYNATLLKQFPILIGNLGNDSQNYIERLKKLNLNHELLTIHENEKTAHAWLLTDIKNNQIIAFHEGAMKYLPKIENAKNTPNLWHLAADNPKSIYFLAQEAMKNNKKYFFDPGQSLPYFVKNDLKIIIKNSLGIFVNEYEMELLENILEEKIQKLINKNQFIINTLGSKGTKLILKNKEIYFDIAQANEIKDPTGCGDAFRAGFLKNYTNGKSLQECIELGSTMGSFAIESFGGQNHKPNFKEIMKRQEKNFYKNKKFKIID